MTRIAVYWLKQKDQLKWDSKLNKYFPQITIESLSIMGF